MRIPRLRDFFTLSSQQEVIGAEEHIIPETPPYAIDLDQLPKIKSSATSVLENVWENLAAAEALMSVSVETAPDVWTPVTLTNTTPLAGEVYLYLSDSVRFPFVPRLEFHSSGAGLPVRIAYTGMGTVPLASYLQTLFDEIASLLAGGGGSGGGGGLAFQLSGPLSTSVDLGEPIVPARSGNISGGTILVLNTGTTGTTTIDIRKCSLLNEGGTSILTAPINISSTEASALIQLEDHLNPAECEIAASDWIRIQAASVAPGAETVSGRLLL